MQHFLSVLLVLIVSLMTLGSPSTASAAMPQQITYQGYLTAADGTPVNKTVNLQLSLYDAATGGAPLWTEQQVVSVSNAQFSVNLAAVTAFNLPFDKPYFLGITVDNDQEMSPRQPFTSSPYAIRSSTADSVADGAVGTGALVDAAVTAAKLGINCAAGQVLMRADSGWGCGTVSAGSSTGIVTGVIAGLGLTGSGTPGNNTLDVDFAGAGSATTAARSDHDHDSAYLKKYGKVAVVAKSGGDYRSPSAALVDVAIWCGVPSAADPCLIKVMPGVYDAGATPISMVDFVDLEGSGESNTTISGSIDSVASGVVNGANSALAKLAVTNSGGANAENSIAIFNTAATFKLFQVSVRAAGAVNTYAVYNSGSGAVRIGASYLDAPGITLFNGSSASAATFTTAFTGGAVRNAGTLACNASRDGKNLFYADTCPPFRALSVIDRLPDSYSNLPNPVVKVQFSNDMNPATINAATFTLINAATMTSAAGVVEYDAATRTATFTPSAALSGSLSSSWVATIGAGVRDLSGGKLPMPYAWSIYVYSGSPDVKPPAVRAVAPYDKSAAVLPAASISAEFDEPIDRLANLAGLLKLLDAKGAAIPGEVKIFDQQVRFLPDAPLPLGATYTATVSGVKDLAGNAQSAPYSWSFATAPITAPSGVEAASGATNAAVAWQPVPGAAGYNLYWSTSPFSDVAGAASNGAAQQPTKVTGVSSPYTFTPPTTPPFSGTLAIYTSGAVSSNIAGVQFTLTVPAGITVAKTSANSATTVFMQSATEVKISYVNSGYYYNDNSLPLLTVECSGDFAGKTPADFTIGKVLILDYNGNPLNGINLTADQSRTAGTTYYYAVTAANAAGESPISSLASASIDPFPPVVTGVKPTGNNIGIPSRIDVGFSEQIDLRSVTSATFAVTAGGAPVEGTFVQGVFSENLAYFSGITFQPKAPLLQGTSYSVTVSGVKDRAGNALQTPYAWSFGTAVSAPANLTATRGDLQSSLAWQPVSGATSYNVYWSTSYGFALANGAKISGVTGASYTHTGLANGTTYYYLVTAVIGATEGLPSNYASASIDNVPPTVISTTPANNATRVSVDTWISVNFSKQMDSSTWNLANVTLTDGNGDVVLGSYNHSSFTPRQKLGFNTTYTMTIGAGVKDSAGNALAAPYSFTFATTPVGTPSGLQAANGNLQSTLTWTAAAGATGYNVYWSTSYGVTPQNGTKISGVTGASYTHTGLSNGTTYYYVVTAVNGTAEGSPSGYASVLIDNVPPTVTSTTPAANATGASITSQIYVGFSKSIDYRTWNNSNVTFKDGKGATVSGSYNHLSFYPNSALSFNTTYTMTIGAGVRDNAGNALAAPYSFSFTTTAAGTPSDLTATRGNLQSMLAWTAAAEATGYNVYWSTSYGVTPQNGTKISGVTGASYTHTGLSNGTTYYYVVTAVNGTAEGAPSNTALVSIDNVPPTIVSTTPANNSTNASLTNAIYVKFSETISYSSWNNANVVFKDSNGGVVNGWYGYPYFYPNSALSFNTTYTMTIGAGVKDEAGNGLAAPYSFSFTTTPVGTPSALRVAKGNLQSTLTWTAAAAATAHNVYWSTTPGVSPQNGNKIAGVTGNSYTHTGLANGTVYYYMVTAVNGSAEGLASNEVAVLIDNVPPTVISSTPAGNSAGISIGSPIKVNFSKNIQISTWNSANVTLADGNGAMVNGSFSYPYFFPNPALNFNTTYTMTIGTGVQDDAGNGLATAYSFSFSTAVATPMGVTAAAGALKTNLAWTAVSGADSYNIYWSNAAGVNKTNSSKISTGSASTTYNHTNLANGSTYFYRVTAVVGTNESDLSKEVTASFDTTPPVVSSYNGGQPGQALVVLFKEPIAADSVTPGAIEVTANGTAVTGNVSMVQTAEVVWVGISSLNYGTTYSVTVSGVKDLAGNLMTPSSHTFTTAAIGLPSVTAAAGSAGTKEIVLSWPSITGATLYNVYWTTAPGVTTANGNKISGATSPFTHNGLTAGAKHYYVVTAASGQIEGAASAEVSAVAP